MSLEETGYDKEGSKFDSVRRFNKHVLRFKHRLYPQGETLTEKPEFIITECIVRRGEEEKRGQKLSGSTPSHLPLMRVD